MLIKAHVSSICSIDMLGSGLDETTAALNRRRSLPLVRYWIAQKRDEATETI